MIMSDIAAWRGPTANKTAGAEDRDPMGLILHVQQGNQEGSISWCKNPDSKVSAHFFADKLGGLVQLVDTADMAWAEVDGNPHWISVECEGYSGEALTPAQLQTVAILLARLAQVYHFPLQISDNPRDVPGVTGHGLGGAAYGGHYDCPGLPILNQRQQLIDEASSILHLAHQGTVMELTDNVEVSVGFADRYPSTSGDGFAAGDEIPVSVLLVGSAIRAANNEHLLSAHSELLRQLVMDVDAIKMKILGS